MAKAVADVDSESNQGGFTSDANGNVTGFSTMHDSGTGGLAFSILILLALLIDLTYFRWKSFPREFCILPLRILPRRRARWL